MGGKEIQAGAVPGGPCTDRDTPEIQAKLGLLPFTVPCTTDDDEIMSDGTLASAVAVPDQDHLRQSPEFPAKRRKSSGSEYEPKRRRLSAQDELSPHSRRRRPLSPAPAPERPAERRPARSGRDEDRKRGQRLFGALLGTLSQKSNPAAQQRRADIEKKQQDKLRSQADEYDELRKRRRERRETIRRKEKPFFEREAMHTRHSNMVAMAHFLKTRTEPILYYKPWQWRAGDEAVIHEQIEDAEATVARETAEFEARYPPEAFVREDLEPLSSLIDDQAAATKRHESAGEPESTLDTLETSAPTTNPHEVQDSAQPTEASAPPANEVEPAKAETVASGADTMEHEQADAHRAAEDDGGEVVEDNEDTVIY
ncbi:hypothetical protein N7492_001862 [Penicillium capsulatum]|uniref:Pinin/SDK/MemA protein domain-containing protein n=1 Tax=Penicillium capsulatum TaxID=69766 RepID=A0A9W9IYM9_9EURO|nr:hypothetical protein N7492_001862 [Penicillium capsulatum]KAJ6129089.1 hypothetical protein N7512_001869 [Penicillium capsulatum]